MSNLNLVVLRALLSKRGWYGLHHLVKVDTFKSAEYRQLYKLIEEMHDTAETDLSLDSIKASVEVQFSRRQDYAETLLGILDLVDETAEVPDDQISKLVKKFLDRSLSYTIAEYISNNAESSDFNVNTVADLAQGAVELSDRISSPVVDIFESKLSGSSESKPSRISLGYSPKLDSSLCGGIGPGELCIYLAPPARGKTSLLIKSGACHAQRGGSVLHVTLEINTRKVIERYDQAWTGLTCAEIETPEGQEKISLARRIVQGSGGEVHVVDWSYLQVGANDIGSLVRRLRGQGTIVDLVVVDYLELMHPNKSPGKEMRQQFSAIGKEIRALARNLNVPVLTAWQVNRVGSGEYLLSDRDISESWDIVKVADSIIGLNQSAAELINKRMRINVVKQRESTNRGMYEMYCDLDRMMVRDIEAEDHFREVRILGDGNEALP